MIGESNIIENDMDIVVIISALSYCCVNSDTSIVI